MARRSTSRTARRTGRSPRRERRLLGCLFWVCLAAIVVAVGFAARGPLQDAFRRLFPAKTIEPARESPAPSVTVAPLEQQEPAESPGRQQAPSTPPSQSTSSPSAAPASPPPERQTVRKARLFFASVDANGGILMKSVIRTIPASDSPLRDTLETLLAGPTDYEMNIGLLTMIPSDARLRAVSLKGDTAYLDFNESFRFNPLGVEAQSVQLRQIVFAATEFPTVKKVQFLIEGHKVVYLGAEGLRIDQPLSRDSFQ
jgi:germination protein M